MRFGVRVSAYGSGFGAIFPTNSGFRENLTGRIEYASGSAHRYLGIFSYLTCHPSSQGSLHRNLIKRGIKMDNGVGQAAAQWEFERLIDQIKQFRQKVNLLFLRWFHDSFPDEENSQLTHPYHPPEQ
jgi:hypothetical protein